MSNLEKLSNLMRDDCSRILELMMKEIIEKTASEVYGKQWKVLLHTHLEDICDNCEDIKLVEKYRRYLKNEVNSTEIELDKMDVTMLTAMCIDDTLLSEHFSFSKAQIGALHAVRKTRNLIAHELSSLILRDDAEIELELHWKESTAVLQNVLNQFSLSEFLYNRCSDYKEGVRMPVFSRADYLFELAAESMRNGDKAAGRQQMIDLAQGGNKNAMFALYECYWPKNEESALNWLKKAVDAGHTPAQKRYDAYMDQVQSIERIEQETDHQTLLDLRNKIKTGVYQCKNCDNVLLRIYTRVQQLGYQLNREMLRGELNAKKHYVLVPILRQNDDELLRQYLEQQMDQGVCIRNDSFCCAILNVFEKKSDRNFTIADFLRSTDVCLCAHGQSNAETVMHLKQAVQALSAQDESLLESIVLLAKGEIAWAEGRIVDSIDLYTAAYQKGKKVLASQKMAVLIKLALPEPTLASICNVQWAEVIACLRRTDNKKLLAEIKSKVFAPVQEAVQEIEKHLEGYQDKVSDEPLLQQMQADKMQTAKLCVDMQQASQNAGLLDTNLLQAVQQLNTTLEQRIIVQLQLQEERRKKLQAFAEWYVKQTSKEFIAGVQDDILQSLKKKTFFKAYAKKDTACLTGDGVIADFCQSIQPEELRDYMLFWLESHDSVSFRSEVAEKTKPLVQELNQYKDLINLYKRFPTLGGIVLCGGGVVVVSVLIQIAMYLFMVITVIASVVSLYTGNQALLSQAKKYAAQGEYIVAYQTYDEVAQQDSNLFFINAQINQAEKKKLSVVLAVREIADEAYATEDSALVYSELKIEDGQIVATGDDSVYQCLSTIIPAATQLQTESDMIYILDDANQLYQITSNRFSAVWDGNLQVEDFYYHVLLTDVSAIQLCEDDLYYQTTDGLWYYYNTKTEQGELLADVTGVYDCELFAMADGSYAYAQSNSVTDGIDYISFTDKKYDAVHTIVQQGDYCYLLLESKGVDCVPLTTSYDKEEYQTRLDLLDELPNKQVVSLMFYTSTNMVLLLENGDVWLVDIKNETVMQLLSDVTEITTINKTNEGNAGYYYGYAYDTIYAYTAASEGGLFGLGAVEGTVFVVSTYIDYYGVAQEQTQSIDEVAYILDGMLIFADGTAYYNGKTTTGAYYIGIYNGQCLTMDSSEIAALF